MLYHSLITNSKMLKKNLLNGAKMYCRGR